MTHSIKQFVFFIRVGLVRSTDLGTYAQKRIPRYVGYTSTCVCACVYACACVCVRG